MVKINDFPFLLFVITTVQIAKTYAEEKCEKNWVKDASTGNCYYISTDKGSHRLAMRICANMGSYLFSTKTLQEHDFLKNELSERRSSCKQHENCNDFWIGLHSFQGKWKWMDGSKPDFDMWSPQYPVPGGGDCAITTIADSSEGYQGAWKNEYCHKVLRFICKSFCPAGFSYNAALNKCYRIITEKLSWEEAWENCSQMNDNANLIILSSEFESENAVSYIKTHTKKNPYFCAEARRQAAFWVGARSDLSSTGCHSPMTWRSSPKVRKDIPMTYTNWNRNEPHCIKNTQTCVQLEQVSDFKWGSKDCEATLCSLCEVNPGQEPLSLL